jgi:hypothetical protein
MSSYSEDMINQITLNCLISKSQLMRINNGKIKKNMDAERNKKINKYRNELVKLFDDLLNKRELSSLFDDVKISYIHFIDKAIIYLDNLENDEKINNNERINDDEKINNNERKILNIINNKSENDEPINNECDDEILNNKTFNDKITNMMNECYDKRYYEMMVENNNKQVFENNDEQICEDEQLCEYDDENDEDDEY